MTEEKDIKKIFIERAKKQKRKIGIAILRPIPETMESLKKASEFADLIVVGAKVNGFENIVEPDQDTASVKLIGLLKEGKVEGIVRGQVKDSFTFDEFHRQFDKKPPLPNHKVFTGILSKGNYTIVTGTGSVYQGNFLEDKIYEAERLIKYMKEDLGIEPKIAVMSSRRPTSKIGAVSFLEDIAQLNEKFAAYLRDKGYQVKEYYIEYETAIWEKWANLIFPSIGLVGNAWLKSLLYLGGWQLLCCAYLDLGVAYEDGTRNEKDFYWHIVHAVAMANSGKA